MKNIYLFLASILLLAFPLQVLAAVDITVKDNSTTNIKSVSVSIDTGTDTLDKIVVAVESSEDVKITEVNTGTISCSSFDYAELSNITTITCELDKAISIEGVLANILFTSTSTDYSFVILDNKDLDIGKLELGDIINVGEIVKEDTATETEETTTLVDETALVTTQQVTEKSSFSLDSLTEYLPYILIAGSVVLLISIIGILLSKKKTPTGMDNASEEMNTSNPLENQPTDLDNISEDISTTQAPTPMPQATSTEPTLKDIVNQNQAVTTPVTTPVEDQGIVAPQIPPVTESIPVTQPIASPADEEQDLQDIMKSESPSIQPESVPTTQPVQNTVETPIQQSPPLEAIMPETAAPVSPEELQNRINEEVNQIANPPIAKTPVVEQPVIQSVNTQETPEDLPPVPPTM